MFAFLLISAVISGFQFYYIGHVEYMSLFWCSTIIASVWALCKNGGGGGDTQDVLNELRLQRGRS